MRRAAPMRRLQPSRACKRDPDTPPPPSRPTISLLDLPTDILEDILQLSAPRVYGARWLWLSRIAGTCRVFRAFAQDPENIPWKFDLLWSFEDDEWDQGDEDANSRVPESRRVQLLHSFMDAKWKGAALTSLEVDNFACLCTGNDADPDILKALRQLLTTPGALPNVDRLKIDVHCDWACSENFHLVDGPFLTAMAKAMPKIQDLELNGCFGTNAKPVKPATLKRFVRSLDQPLDSLTLGTCEWLRDEHLQALLPNTDLMSLSLYQCVQYEDDSSDDDVWGWQPARKTCLTDKGLEVIGRCCDRLHDLTLTYLDITTRGVECALRGPGESLNYLNLSVCHRIDASVFAVIGEHACNLWSFRADNCRWYNDAGLLLLVTSQAARPPRFDEASNPGIPAADFRSMQERLDPQRCNVSLRTTSLMGTSITPRGLRQALDAAPGVLGVQSFLPGGIETATCYTRHDPEWEVLFAEYENVNFVLDL